MSPDEIDDETARGARGQLAEKELFLLLLVGIVVLMAITGFVLVIN